MLSTRRPIAQSTMLPPEINLEAIARRIEKEAWPIACAKSVLYGCLQPQLSQLHSQGTYCYSAQLRPLLKCKILEKQLSVLDGAWRLYQAAHYHFALR